MNKQPKRERFRILAPYLSYGKHDRHQNSVVDDLPAESISWLLADGLIEAAPDAPLFDASPAGDHN